ncbi:MAG TPA: glycosyltransferase family 1 protein [candidate division Zixibacteria bacterium]|nr:glycosyltransferase family 1 protein [candidate division Zixibacteria bacterium]
MKVLILRNYPHDGFVSMRVFADVMCRELQQRKIEFQQIAPKPFFGRIRPSVTGLGKWLGYIDRFLIFPSALRRAAADADLVHICDHGNAMYARMLRETPVLVTCHDLLAVRAALGDANDCAPSFSGRFLQKWIVSGLRKATRVACVSQFTYRDATTLLGSTAKVCKVINGLPYPFRVLNSDEAKSRLSTVSGLHQPFILHLGGGHRRKNREGVLRVFAKARAHVELQLVLAGEQPGEQVLALVRELGIGDHVLYLKRPATEIVEALYNRAAVLLFPSRYEGFGWPPIEAQACGCPVVASNIAPIAEVLGDSAELFSPDDEDGMAEAVVRLMTDQDYREQLRQRGFHNVRTRFETSRMVDDYLKLYREICAQAEIPEHSSVS